MSALRAEQWQAHHSRCCIQALGQCYVQLQGLRPVHGERLLVCFYVLTPECTCLETRQPVRQGHCTVHDVRCSDTRTSQSAPYVQGTMVAGYDPSGPALYYVDSDGQRTKGQIFSVGSGSLYAYGVLDNGYKWCVFSLSASCSTAQYVPAEKAAPDLLLRRVSASAHGHVKAAHEGIWTLRMRSSSAGDPSTTPPSVTLSVEAQ